ncbi:unnamed protein product [Adineta ricciae]|uniref:Uncharacterized protein n=1 Tax=Adineta ricciae TaxID=249248 RepID=A0A816BDA2_ADIRI|nr:unnamed protein product [Adineta ricciae]CAF1608953.1 unnamed protein product [Adineta ricciae]
MHILIRCCLALVILAVIVDSQGARGGGGFRGGGSTFRGGYRSTSSGCTGSGCPNAGVIVGAVLGSIFGLVAIILGAMYCYHRSKGRPLHSNPNFVATASGNQDQMYSKACFETGVWSSRYHQYNSWHGPYQLSLTFDPKMSRVDGKGSDDVGSYTIDGVYSYQTNRLALTKIYTPGTGNALENYGHNVTLQMDWNAATNQFEGKWFIQSKKYRGVDKFEMKFHQAAEIPCYQPKY